MKTDTIFYRIFVTCPTIFFELIDMAPGAADNYHFDSIEVKDFSFRLDGVFIPKEEVPDVPFYFTEVQFQPDEKFYARFFAEIFTYLHKTERVNNWRGVVIYPRRSVESKDVARYRELVHSERVRRIYLDELNPEITSVGLSMVKLIIEPEGTAVPKAQELIKQTRVTEPDTVTQKDLIELIEAIIIYKFKTKSREEIETMLGLGDLRQTRVYQEAKLEGKLEGQLEGKLEGKLEGQLGSVPYMLSLGATVEQIAQALGLDLEMVKQAASQNPSHNSQSQKTRTKTSRSKGKKR